MFRNLFALFVLGLSALLSLPAQAQTVESGWWWNPQEGGVGYNLEIQDNFVFLAAYTYESTGSPRMATWFTAQGEMQDAMTFETNEVYTFQNGTCPTCSTFTPAQIVTPPAALRPLRIEFDSETTGVLTWGGQEIAIQRYDFYLSRQTSGNDQISPKTELWLGEWQAVMDFYQFNDIVGSRYFGEVLVFENMAVNDTAEGTDFFDGCRPWNSLVALCEDIDYDEHDASGFFAPGQGPDGADVNYIFVKDGAAADGRMIYLVFEVVVGTYQFDGIAKVCYEEDINADLGGNFIEDCLNDNGTYPEIPVRGWRSASRTFVDGGNGPNAELPGVKSQIALERPAETSKSRFGHLLIDRSAASTQAATPASAQRKSNVDNALLERNIRRILARHTTASK